MPQPRREPAPQQEPAPEQPPEPERSGSGSGGRFRGGGRRRGDGGGGARRRSQPVGLDVALDIIAADTAAQPGARDQVGIDAVLADESTHDRRQDLALGGAGRAVGRGGRRRRSRGRGRLGCRGRLRSRSGSRCGSRSRRGRGRRSRLRSRSSRGGSGSSGGGTITDHGQDGPDLDRLALGHPDLGQRARHRRRDLGVDLVGRYLEQDLVLADGVTHLLEPAGDGPLGDGFSQLRHLDVGHGDSAP